MAVKYEFMEKIGVDVPLSIGDWKTIPKTRYKPTRDDATLEPTIYTNLGYTNTSTTKPGRAWFRMVRENPEDDTCNFMLWLPPGYSMVLDERMAGNKWWQWTNRYVHWEVKVTGVKSAFLNDSCYVSYCQKW